MIALAHVVLAEAPSVCRPAPSVNRHSLTYSSLPAVINVAASSEKAADQPSSGASQPCRKGQCSADFESISNPLYRGAPSLRDFPTSPRSGHFQACRLEIGDTAQRGTAGTAATEPREAYGVRPACWRFPECSNHQSRPSRLAWKRKLRYFSGQISCRARQHHRHLLAKLIQCDFFFLEGFDIGFFSADDEFGRSGLRRSIG